MHPPRTDSSLLATLLIPGNNADCSCFNRNFPVFGTCILGQDLDSTASGTDQSYIESTFLFPEHENWVHFCNFLSFLWKVGYICVTSFYIRNSSLFWNPLPTALSVGQSLSFVQPKEDDQDVDKGLRIWRLVQCAKPAPLDTWTSLVGHRHIEANSNDSKDSEQEGIVYISPKSPVEVIQNISNISICCNRWCFITLIVLIIIIIPINLKLIDSHKTLERGYFRNGGLRKPSWNMPLYFKPA